MKPKLLWILAAFAAALLIYQVMGSGSPEVGPGPGLAPGGGPRSGVTREDSSLHRSSQDAEAPRGEIRAQLTGVVRDHLGSPRAGERIWILRPGEKHPKVLGHAKPLKTVESDASGRFQVELGPEDEWHFSVGAIGTCELTTEVRRFRSGEQAEVEIILNNAAHLSVEVTAAAGVNTALQPARIEILRKSKKGDDDLIPFGAPPVPGFGLDPMAKPVAPAAWNTSAALGLRFGEALLFSRLKLGDTYRVAVVLGPGTATSTTDIVLQAGEDRVARCLLEEREGVLSLSVKLQSAPSKAATQAGFHWKP